jgi:hypothetical protein
VECEEQLDLHRLQALTQQWRRTPPLAELVASFLGYEEDTPADPTDPEAGFAAFENLFAAAGGTLG